MKVSVLEIIRGSKSDKVLSACVKYLENVKSNYIEGHTYKRQINGRQVKASIIEKEDYKKYDELSKKLEVVFLGYYRQRVYTEYILEIEEKGGSIK